MTKEELISALLEDGALAVSQVNLAATTQEKVDALAAFYKNVRVTLVEATAEPVYVAMPDIPAVTV